DRSGGNLDIIACDTEDGIYLAFQVELPADVAKGNEGRVLDAERDSFAQRLNGRIVSEKKIDNRGLIGRDFTIRGQPAGSPAPCTIRMRQSLTGRNIYMVAVISNPEASLPDDAGRFLASLQIGTAKTRPIPPPEPEPKGTEVPGWGLAIDRDRDCEFTPNS